MPHYSETGRGMPEEATTVPDTFEGFEAAARHGLKIAFQNGMYPFSLRVDVHYDPDNMPKPSKLGAALMKTRRAWREKQQAPSGDVTLYSHAMAVVSVPGDTNPYSPELKIHIHPLDPQGTSERFEDFIGALRAHMP